MPAARARLTVDLDALSANYRWFRDQAADAEVAPVVKANGYGLGAAPVAKRLWAEGARSFHVARLEEGEALRAALGHGRPARIFVLDGAPAGSADRLVDASLIPALSSLAQIETYAARARSGNPLPCAIHVDTGMNRLGLRPEALEALLGAPGSLDGLKVELVMSHLACAEDAQEPLNAQQADRLIAAARLLPGVPISLANSAGVLLGQGFHFDMVRPGIGLYGGGPLGRPHAELKPVARLQAPILDVRDVREGETVGYGMEFTADGPLKIAVAAIGYADGVLRASWPGGDVWFAGQRRRLAGRVSMDLITVDVTGCEVGPGAMVELFGPNLMIDHAADAARTNAYELLTRLSDRAERTYIGQID